MRFRRLKQQMADMLCRENLTDALECIDRLPASPEQAVNPLFSFFHNQNELIRWRAVTAMGHMVDRMVSEGRKEAARVVMRRLIWNLNDESGGIGWGSPEAMGEIMARNSIMADEYNRILVSYILPHGNFLEHEILQRGLLWGIGRLAHQHPAYGEAAVPWLVPFLTSPDPFHRGLASWTAGWYHHDTTDPLLQKNQQDSSTLTFYSDGRIREVTVASLAIRHPA